VSLSVVNPAGFTLAASSVRLTTRVGTTLGSVVSGSDAGNGIRLELRQRGSDVRFNLRLVTEALPASSVYEAVRFLRHVHAPNRLQVSASGVELQTLAVPVGAERLDPTWVDAVRALAFVQREAGVSFELPNLDPGTIRTVRVAERLLRGEKVTGRWTDAKVQTPDRRFAELFAGSAFCRLEMEQDHVVQIGGNRVVLGDAHYTLNTTRLAMGPDHLQELGLFALELRPANGDDTYSVELIDPPGSSIGDPYGSSVTLDAAFLLRAER
jgi:hypothetical protein